MLIPKDLGLLADSWGAERPEISEDETLAIERTGGRIPHYLLSVKHYLTSTLVVLAGRLFLQLDEHGGPVV